MWDAGRGRQEGERHWGGREEGGARRGRHTDTVGAPRPGRRIGSRIIAFFPFLPCGSRQPRRVSQLPNFQVALSLCALIFNFHHHSTARLSRSHRPLLGLPWQVEQQVGRGCKTCSLSWQMPPPPCRPQFQWNSWRVLSRDLSGKIPALLPAPLFVV